MKKSRYTRYFKYPLDCLIAAFLILLTSPVLLSTILLLAIANRGSGIFFLQERPGKNGKIFRIIKFKTMNDRKDCRGNFLPDSLRMTPIGKIVRATSVDELPQLFNVLKGDMALIGPVHYWYNTCLYTMKSKQEDMKCAPALLDGHK